MVTDLTLGNFFKVKLWWLDIKVHIYEPCRSFKHKIVATSIKLPLPCVLIILLFCNVQPVCWKSKAADLMLLIPVLLLSQPIRAVDTFVHLATDVNILQFFLAYSWSQSEYNCLIEGGYKTHKYPAVDSKWVQCSLSVKYIVTCSRYLHPYKDLKQQHSQLFEPYHASLQYLVTPMPFCCGRTAKMLADILSISHMLAIAKIDQ